MKNSKLMIIIPAVGISLSLIIGIIFFVPGIIKNNKLEKAIDEANALLLDEDYKEAISAYGNVLKIEKDNSAALIGLAEAYISLAEEKVDEGNIDEAIQILEEGFEKTEKKKIESYLKDIKQLKSQEEADNKTEKSSEPATGGNSAKLKHQALLEELKSQNWIDGNGNILVFQPGKILVGVVASEYLSIERYDTTAYDEKEENVVTFHLYYEELEGIDVDYTMKITVNGDSLTCVKDLGNRQHTSKWFKETAGTKNQAPQNAKNSYSSEEAFDILLSKISGKYQNFSIMEENTEMMNNKEYYVFRVFEDAKDHIVTLGWYYVDSTSGEVYEWDLINDKYILIN